ncbi:MAG: hypothetical protein ACWGQW_04105 [bacterium]
MAIIFEIPTAPISIQPDKLGVLVSTEPYRLVTPGHIAAYIGDNVPVYRALEITNGWMWLWASLRDKSLINLDQPTNGRINAYSHIDHLTETDRRITWEGNLDPQPEDIGVGISVESQIHGGVNQIEVAFRMLRDWAMENFFK